MTRRLLLRALPALALALAGLPGPARAQVQNRLELTGHLGAGYSRGDTWTAGLFNEVHDTVPAVELLAGAQLSYVPFRPDLLRLRLGVDYGQSQVNTNARSRVQNLTYQGTVQALTEWPLSVELGAARLRTDFTNNLGGSGTGVTSTDSQRAALTFRMPDLPVLNAAFQRVDTENEIRDRPITRGGADSLSVGANQSLNALTYGVKYDTSWARGDYVDSNYRSHQVGVQVGARPADNLTLDLTESWFQRDPTRQVIGNPRFESNYLNLASQWRSSDRTYLSAFLSDTRSDIRVPGDPDRSFRAQAVNQTLQHRLLPEWWLLQGASLARSTEQEGTRENSGVSGTATGGARWVRDTELRHVQVEGTATVGALQPSQGSTQLAWGLRGDFQMQFSSLARRWQTSYGISYGDNTAGREGTIFNHEGRLVVDLLAGGRMSALARLHASQVINESPLFGRIESRQAQLQLESRIWHLELGALGGMAHGSSDLVFPSGVPGGEPITSDLRSTSSFAQLSAGATLWRSLRSQLLLSWRATESPNRGAREEMGAALQLGYSIGAFLVTVEDRVTASSADGSTNRSNYFFVRATRSFALGL